MEVRWVRYGNIVTYDQEQSKFIFETTFEANWGAEPGSGQEKTGAFHDVIAPELIKVFNQPYTLHCNEIRHGGATYDVSYSQQRISTRSILPAPINMAISIGIPGQLVLNT